MSYRGPVAEEQRIRKAEIANRKYETKRSLINAGRKKKFNCERKNSYDPARYLTGGGWE